MRIYSAEYRRDIELQLFENILLQNELSQGRYRCDVGSPEREATTKELFEAVIRGLWLNRQLARCRRAASVIAGLLTTVVASLIILAVAIFFM